MKGSYLKWLMRFLVLGAAAFTIALLWQGGKAASSDSEKRFFIGVSQPDLNEPRQVVMNKEIRQEAEKHKNARFIFTDAAENSDKQIHDVEKLMDYGIDLLIISLNDPEKLTPIVSEIHRKIPVIVLGRGVTGYDYTLFIGPDNLSIGKKSGELAAKLLTDKTGILEIMGNPGPASKNDISQGFREFFQKNPALSVIQTAAGDWQRDKAEDEVRRLLPQTPDVGLIFAHSDAMALGAYRAVQISRPDIKIMGIDGLDTVNGGFELVKQGVLSGTVTSPTGGKESVRYAIDILRHVKGLPKKIILRSHLITQANADRILAEMAQREQAEQDPVLPAHKIKLGVAVVGSESSWRSANTESILRAARQDKDIELNMQNAQGSQEKQIQILRSFIAQKVDVISFTPIVETGWDEVLAEAKKAGIPVLLTDRKVKVEDDSLWMTFIGSDFIEEGRRAARWLAEREQDVPKPVRIVELQGTPGSAPAIERHEGFTDELSQHPFFRLESSQSGDFTIDSGKLAMKKVLQQSGSAPDVVFAHNDDMALGANHAMEEAGIKPGKDVIVISVDATKSAFQAMISGKLNMSVECNPLLGPQIVKAVKDAAEGKEIPRTIITEEGIFSQETAKRDITTRTY